jgi:amicyanin
MVPIALLVVALLLGSVGIGALAAGYMGPHGGTSSASGPMGPMGGNGPGGMMGGNGPGGMMGGNGHGMMGGNGPGGQGQAPDGTGATGATQIAIQNFAYQPTNVSIKVGATLTWTNKDSAPHTVTFRNGMKDSGMLRQGQSFSYTFTAAGTYAYYCAYHPYMVGQVVLTA